MNPDQINKRLDVMCAGLQVQVDLMAVVVTQLAEISASVQVALATQREMLAKQGVSKDETARCQEAARAIALVTALELVKPHLESLGQTKKDFGDSQQAEKN